MSDPIPLHWFDYELPPARIAQEPVRPRDASRMMVVSRSGDIAPQHRHFRDIVGLLSPGDVLVVNRTKVIPARLPVVRAITGGRGELLLYQPVDGPLATATTWEALGRPGSVLKPGNMLKAEDGTELEVVSRTEMVVQVRGREALLPLLMRAGKLPLPPYIGRGEGKAATPVAMGDGTGDLGSDSDADSGSYVDRGNDADAVMQAKNDATDYQTVFAKEEGAVAAPTASLHFTDGVLAALRARGVVIVDVLLHVGPGTFLPVRRECEADIRQHQMHAEWYQVPDGTVEAIEKAHSAGRRVVAVGTTSLRALETWHLTGARAGASQLFVYPGFQFGVVNGLLTNFHLPRSTLLMLVSAFSDRERILQAYAEAIRAEYRFFSYGDAMLLW